MGLPFYHGNAQFQNLIADEQTYPAIYLDQPITNTYKLGQSGYMAASYPIKLIFLFKSELDWTTTQHDVNCIQPAETKIRDFVNRLEANGSIDLIEGLSAYEFINLFDANVSGKGLEVTIQLNNEYVACV